MSPQVYFSTILKRTISSLTRPQVFLFLFLPMVVSILLAILILGLTYDFWMSLWNHGLAGVQPYFDSWIKEFPTLLRAPIMIITSLASWIWLLLLFLFSVPLILALNTLFMSVLASTYLVSFIAKQEYPDLEKKGGDRFFQGLWNTISSLFLFLFIWLVTLPFWLIPGAALLIPILLAAWLNQRVCLFDALAEHATDEEMYVISSQAKSKGLMWGLLMSGFQMIPLAFLFSPVIIMVGYVHLGLSYLEKHRQ